MLTLRTLKKASKQALPILRKHYPDAIDGEVVLTGRGERRQETYHGHVIRCTHGAGDPCVVPDRPRCECTLHPLPGTPMIGGMSGYYEPEWSECTTLAVLIEVVLWGGGKPATMTEREWRRTLAITKTTPITDAQMAAWARDDDDLDALPPTSPRPIEAGRRD